MDRNWLHNRTKTLYRCTVLVLMSSTAIQAVRLKSPRSQSAQSFSRLSNSARARICKLLQSIDPRDYTPLLENLRTMLNSNPKQVNRTQLLKAIRLCYRLHNTIKRPVH